MSRFKQVDLSRVRTVSLAARESKVATAALGRVPDPDGAHNFLDSLPGSLKARELRQLISIIGKARARGLPFHIMLGAHVIKVGLSGIIIDLMESGIVSGLSLNSAGIIHDLELSFTGKTSEDVKAGLEDGSFGMAKETGELFAGVVELAEAESTGLGEAAGKYINGSDGEYKAVSILGAAERLNLPATVHIAIGADIVHQQGNFRAGPAAEASYRDFRILANILIQADQGGVVANIGSAVILPEVFLKALAVARNLSAGKRQIYTANFDMISHYRPMENVVRRPTDGGKRGFNFIGHHEIMIPLLAWGLKADYRAIQKENGEKS